MQRKSLFHLRYHSCLHDLFCVPFKRAADVGNGHMQTYSMEDQYESVNLADYDVVRSTQFVDDLSRGVHVSHI